MAYVTGRIVHDADVDIMETPNWLRQYADPALREQLAPLSLSGGNELRQTGDPDEQLRDLDAAFARLAEKHRSPEYVGAEAAEIMAREELRGDGIVPRRGSPACARPPGFREPVDVQYVPQSPPARLGAQR